LTLAGNVTVAEARVKLLAVKPLGVIKVRG